MATDAKTLNMILGGSKTKKVRRPAKKRVRIGASVELHLDGKTYVIGSKDSRYKDAYFIDGLEFSFSRDMFKVL